MHHHHAPLASATTVCSVTHRRHPRQHRLRCSLWRASICRSAAYQLGLRHPCTDCISRYVRLKRNVDQRVAYIASQVAIGVPKQEIVAEQFTTDAHIHQPQIHPPR